MRCVYILFNSIVIFLKETEQSINIRYIIMPYNSLISLYTVVKMYIAYLHIKLNLLLL